MEWNATAAMLLAGLLFNFVGMIVGGISLAFTFWRWLTTFQQTMIERVATVETDVKHLLHAQGHARRTEDIEPWQRTR